MTNVTRLSSGPAHTALIYYLVQYYDDFLLRSDVNDTVTMTAAEHTCQLMTSLDVQHVAVMLGHLVITQCLGSSLHTVVSEK